MTEMDLGLDLGKKKKKKKVDMGVDALKELIAGDTTQQQVKQDEPVGGVGGAVSDQSVEKKQEDYDKELEEMLHMKKRKPRKKKQPLQDMASMGQALEESSGTVKAAASSSAVAADKKPEAAAPEKDTFDDFELPKKKKKRRPNITFEGYDILAVVEEIGGEEGDADTAAGTTTEDGEGGWKTVEALPWEDSDRDYTYEELLERVFNIIKQNNPNYASGQRKKLVMKPPQVVRVGAKKTSFVNFTEICRLLHRQPKHLMNFLLVELGTSASLDGTQQLIIKGKFQQKQIETVLRRYIKEYVTCHTCRSPETNLHKETRLFFLQCETCGSRCSVQNIKSGFQAVTGKRAQMRSKAQ